MEAFAQREDLQIWDGKTDMVRAQNILHYKYSIKCICKLQVLYVKA
jgi:hypothetical protein